MEVLSEFPRQIVSMTTHIGGNVFFGREHDLNKMCAKGVVIRGHKDDKLGGSVHKKSNKYNE